MYNYWKSYFQERSFFIYSTFIILILIVFQCFYSKGELFIMANGFHAPALDNFFEWYTYVGDGIFCITLCVILFFFDKKLSYRLLAGFLISGLVAQVLKNAFQAPRPKTFFAEGVYTHFIDGVTHSGYHSFPSGHTTTAFVMIAMLASRLRNKYCTLLLLIAAFGVAYSRVYLGQHFVQDVAAGSVIGLLTAIVVEHLQKMININPVFNRKYSSSIHKPAEPVYIET